LDLMRAAGKSRDTGIERTRLAIILGGLKLGDLNFVALQPRNGKVQLALRSASVTRQAPFTPDNVCRA
jgi:hypothetical protein